MKKTALILAAYAVFALMLLSALPAPGEAEGKITPAFWLACIVLGIAAIDSIRRVAALDAIRYGDRFVGLLTAALFGLWIVYFWQILVVAFGVPRVILPPPSLIAQSLMGNIPRLWDDFVQTVVQSVLVGWVLGCGLGFAVAVAIDRMPFLQRGLLPIASLTSAVPLVGVAPIAVMWFGFEWQSKAAVVVLMTFFPMLVSTLAGLKAAGKLELELMHGYAASYWQTLLSLRLPAAMLFIFGALKVNATLALIGAIVAEFFGSPTHGIGFRISSEAGKMNMPLVWASIVVAAVVGSLAYSLLVQLERKLAFWHPSVRGAK
jgi:NitT/TauT family transport system permease protein